jgi:Flp pilus assembly protein TadB
VINQWPLRDRLWLFFGLGLAVTGGGVWATLTGKGPVVVLVFIVAAALFLRGLLDLLRAWRHRDDG